MKIQKSTRTTIPHLESAHNFCRMKFGWYYRWHLNNLSDAVHWSALTIFILAVSAFGILSFRPADLSNPKGVQAAVTTLVSKDNSGVFQAKADETEVLDKRTENSKTFDEGNGKYRVASQIGAIQYKNNPSDPKEQYKEIDLTIRNTQGQDYSYAMDNNGYQAHFFNSREVDGQKVNYIAQFRRDGKFLEMAPVELDYENAAGERQIISQTVPDINPETDNDNYTLTYKNAFGDGIDFRYNVGADKFFKTVIVNSKDKLPTPTIGTDGLKLTVVMSLSWDDTAKPANGFAKNITTDEVNPQNVESKPLDQATPTPSATATAEVAQNVKAEMPKVDETVKADSEFSYKDQQNKDLWWMQPTKAWDSAEEPNTWEAQQSLKRTGNNAFDEISIPVDQLNDSKTVYPFFLDTAISEIQVAASTDDAVSGGTWPGDANYSSSGVSQIVGYVESSYYTMLGSRFLSVPLPNGATINSASISLCANVDISANVTWAIAAEAVDSAATFGSGHTPYNAYQAKGTQVVSWAIGTAAWTGGTFYPSQDISTIIQELVNRGGWASGNNLNLEIYAASSAQTAGRGIRTYDYTGSAPKFNATYTLPGHNVSGTIVDGSANPIPGVSVSDGTRSATTAANGTYSIADVPDGTYTLAPTKTNYTFSPTTISATVSGADLTGKDFTSSAVGHYTTVQPPYPTPIDYAQALAPDKGGWLFNENTGTAIHDQSISAQNATVENVGSSAWQAGPHSGYAYKMDGTASYVDLTTPGNVTMGGAASASFWVYWPGSAQAYTTIFYASTSTSSIELMVKSNNTLSEYGAGGAPTIDGTGPTLNTNAWNHIVVTVDSSALKLYANGGAAVTSNGNANFTGSLTLFRIGGDVDYWNGNGRLSPANTAFENVGLYNRVISAADKDSLYASPYQMYTGPAPTITISGTAYTTDAKSATASDGTSIGLSVNGGAASTVATTTGGVFSFTGVTVAANDTVTIFYNSNYNGNLISQAVDASTNITGLELYGNDIVIRHETAGPMTNTLLATANNCSSGCGSNLHFTDSAGAVTFAAGYKVWITAGKTYTPGGATTLESMNIPATSVFSPGSNAVTITGTGTPLSISGTFTAGTSTVNYTGGTTATNITSATYYNLYLNHVSTTYTAAGDITVSNVFTINAGTFNASSRTITLSGTTGTPFVKTGTLNAVTSTFIYSGDYASGNTTITAGSYNNLQINNALETYTIGAASLDIAGSFTATAGTLIGTGDIIFTLDSSASISGDGTINLTGGTVYIYGGLNIGGNTNWTFYNLSLDSYWCGDETYTAIGSGSITVAGVLANYSCGGISTLNAGAKTWILSGTTGTPFINGGTFTASTSTVKYTGNYASGNTNVVATTYNNLYFDNASETYVAAGNITVSSVLTINAGTFDASSRTITLSGSGTPFVATGTFTPSTSTILYTGTSATNITASTYYNLTLNRTGTTFTQVGNPMITNNLTVTLGTYAAGTNNIIAGNVIQSGGTFTAPGSSNTFTVNGGWNHSSGTFTHNSGTVTFAGDALIQGSTTFNNFTATTAGRTLSFVAATTQTISGTWTVTGTSGSHVVLQRSGASGVWNVNPTTATINYVTVSNSTDTNAASIAAYYSTDGGGNTKWLWFPPTVVNSKSLDNIAQVGTGRAAVYKVDHQGTALTVMTNGTRTSGSEDSWNGSTKTEDYWGVSFNQYYGFNEVVYTTGALSGGGSYFASGLKVQVRQNNVWVDVTSQTIDPVYTYSTSDLAYKTFTLAFADTFGDAVRIYGVPAGSVTFTTISEFEAYYLPRTIANSKGTDNLASTGTGRAPLYVVDNQGNALTVMTNGAKTGSEDSWNGSGGRTADWWGLQFIPTYGFNKVVYTTGSMFADGGWFASGLKTQVRQDNTWVDVSNPVISPSYPYNNTAGPNVSYTITFDDTSGDAIRVNGVPAGSHTFTSISEFEAYYSDTIPAAPTGVSIGSIDSTLFTANWTDNSSNETGFKVYVSTTPNSTCSAATYPGSPDFTTAANAVSQAVTGKSVNSQYCVKVASTNSAGDSSAAYSSPAYTLANRPDAPTVNATSSSSLTVIINANNNPTATQFAIYNQTAGQYVQANGTLGASAVWQTRTTWGGDSGITNTGLSGSTSYTYQVKARNGDNTETTLSIGASQTTQSAGITVSGNIYQSGSESTLDTTAYTVKVSVNNATPVAATVPGDGTFTASGVTANSGDSVAVYIEGNANDANTITVTNGSTNITNLQLFVGKLAVGNNNSYGTTTNTNICNQAAYPPAGDQLYSCSGINLTVSSNVEFHVLYWGGDVNYDTGAGTLTTQGTGGLHVSGGGNPPDYAAKATLTSATNIAGDVVVVNGSILVIASTNTVTVAGNWTNSGIFTANSSTVVMTGTGKTMTGNSQTFNNLTIDTGATIAGSGNFNVGGTMTINASAVFTPAATEIINTAAPAGTITGSGTAQVTRTSATADYSSQYKFTTNTLTNLTVEYTGASAQTVSVVAYGNLKISTTASAVATMAGDTTISGVLTISSGGTFDASSRTITLSGTTGTPFVKTGTFTPSTSTLIYSGNNAGGDTTITATTYNNLTINNAAENYTIGAGTVTINADFTATAGTLIGTGNITVKGNVQCGVTCGSVNMGTGSTFTQYVAGVNKNFGTSVAGTTAWIFYNLTFENTSAITNTITTSTTGTGDITINSVLTIGGLSVTLNAGNRIWHIMGTGTPFTIIHGYGYVGGVLNPGTSTFSFEGTSGTIVIEPATYYNLQTNPASGTPTYTLGTARFVGGAEPCFTAGTKILVSNNQTKNIEDLSPGDIVLSYDINSHQTATSNVTNTAIHNVDYYYLINGKVNATANQVFILADDSQKSAEDLKNGDILSTANGPEPVSSIERIDKTTTVYDIEVAAYHLFYANGFLVHNSIVIDPVSVGGNLTLTGAGGTMNVDTIDPSLTITGNLSIESGKTFVASPTAVFSIAGNFTNSGNFTASGGTVTMNAGSGGKTLSGTMTGSSAFNNLTFNNAAGGWALSNDIKVGSVLTITAGALDASSKTIELSGTGTPFVKTGTFTPSTSTINYTGGTTATNITATTYNNLILNHASTTYIAAGDITTTGVLTINAGTFDASNRTITLSGSGTPFVVTDTFTPSTSTVSYTGSSATNIAATTYNNLTVAHAGTTFTFLGNATVGGTLTNTTASSYLVFHAGSIYTLAAININGQATTTRITLRSSTAGSTYHFNVSGASPVASNVDVKDADASGGNLVNATTGGWDAGNNTNWSFPTVTWISGWSNRSVITVDHTKVGIGGVTNYPVLVTESNMPAGFWTHVKSDGSDIRVTNSDGTTETNFELVSIDTSGHKMELWFLAPSLSSSADTNFYLYWGNSGASAKAASWGQGVWTTAGYVGVWHLNENAASTTVKDSTGLGNTGTATRNTSYLSSAGIISGSGFTFNGSSDAINVADSTSLRLSTPLTVSAWVKTSVASGNNGNGIIRKDSANDTPRYLYGLQYGGYQIDPSLGEMQYYNGGSIPNSKTDATLNNGNWHQLTGTISGTTMNLYSNGVQQGSPVTITGTQGAPTQGLAIGADPAAGGGPENFFFNGSIDEARVASVAASQAQATTDYNTQSSPSTFYTLGSEQTNVPVAPTNAAIGNIGSTTFDVTWTDNSSDETGFKVYISTVPNATCSAATYPGSPDYTTAANATTQSVTGKSINSQYCAKVVATNAGGDSTASYSTPHYTLANQPDAPTVEGGYTVAGGLGYFEHITINPNNNPAGTNYWIQYSTDNVTYSDPAGMAWQTGTSYDLTGLNSNTQYWFKVKAKNGDATDTSYSSAGADVTPPAAPLSLNSSNLCRTTVSTSWVAAVGADKYTFSYGTDAQATNLGATSDITSTNKDLTGLTNNTPYYFKVSATSNANGTGAYSSIATFTTGTCTAPVAPSDFAGAAASSSQINWTWTDTADDEIGWHIQDTSHTNIHDLAANSTSWNEASLSVNTAYTRHANVYNANGSNDSNQATVYTLANTPSAPTATKSSSTAIRVTINVNGNPADTHFAIKETNSGKFVRLSDGTLQTNADWQTYADWGSGSGINVNGLSPNTSYTFAVEAANEAAMRFDGGGNPLNQITAFSSGASDTTYPTYTVTIGNAGNGTGTLDQSTQVVNWGTNLTINATPAVSSNFASYTGCDSTNGTACTLTNITANKLITATFTLKTYTVTIATAGNGTGSLDQATQTVNYGANLTINATPNVSSNFTGWSGDASGTDAATLSNITANKSITATFTLKTYTVVVTSTGTGTGTFSQGTQTVNYGSDLSTVASANSGSNFISFTGCDSTSGGDNSTCNLVNITSGKTLTSTFALIPTATISINGGAFRTKETTVDLTLSTNTATDMKISNLSNLSDVSYATFETSKNNWALLNPGSDGTKTIYLKVKDQYGKESSVYSSLIILDTAAPGVPTNLAAEAGNTTISLSWTNPSDADLQKIKVYRGTTADFDLSSADKTFEVYNGGATYVDPDVANNTNYFYKVTAIDDVGNESGVSNEVTGKADSDNPTTPGKPTVSETTINIDGKIIAVTKKLTFNWTPSSDLNSGLKNYLVNIGSSSGKSDLLSDIIVAGGDNSAIVIFPHEFTSDGTYYIRVNSQDNKGNFSASSDEFIITIDTTPPSDPVSALMYDVSDRADNIFAAAVSWKSSTDATAGLAGYSITKNGTELNLGNDKTTQGIVTDTKSGYSFYLDLSSPDTKSSYTVKAVDKAGNATAEIGAKLADTELTRTTGQKAGDATITLPNSIIGEGKLDISNIKVEPSGVVSEKTQAKITWDTTVPATSQVDSGASSEYGRKTDLDTGLNSSHTVILSDLSPSSTFHFKVTSKDKHENEIASSDQSFTTGNVVKQKTIIDLIADTLSSSFSRLWNSFTGLFSMNSNISYAADSTFSGLKTLFVGDITTPNQSGYAVYWPLGKGNVTIERSENGGGYTSIGNTDKNFFLDFTTKPGIAYSYKVSDLTGVAGDELSGKSIISNIKIDSGTVEKANASVIVTFKTDKLAKSQVNYGVGSDLSSSTTLDTALNQSHTILIENLKPNLNYSFQLKSVDKSGENTTQSEIQKFTTGTAPQDLSLFEVIVKALEDAFKGFNAWVKG